MRIRNRTTFRYILRSPITLVVSFLIVIILGRAVWNVHVSAQRARDKMAKYDAELSRLNIKKAEVEKRLEYLSTSEGVESELRNRYRAITPGEMVAVIVRDDSASNTVFSSIKSEDNSSKSLWSRFLDLFVK